MTTPAENPFIAVTMLHHGDQFLLPYNTNWRCFTLPMTKVRGEFQGDTKPTADQWADAAAHAAVECLNTACNPLPMHVGPYLIDYENFEISGRDGALRHYHYKIFSLSVEKSAVVMKEPHVWLTIAQIRSGSHRPLSPTVQKLLKHHEVLQELSL